MEEVIKLGAGEGEGGLVVGDACVGDEAVDAAVGGDDGVDGCLDLGLNRYVCLEEEEVGVLMLESEEVGAGGFDVEGIDGFGGIAEAHFGDPEADALVGACDCCCL